MSLLILRMLFLAKDRLPRTEDTRTRRMLNPQPVDAEKSSHDFYDHTITPCKEISLKLEIMRIQTETRDTAKNVFLRIEHGIKNLASNGRI